MEERFDIEYHAEIGARTLEPDDQKKTTEAYRLAKATLYRTLAGQTWVLAENHRSFLPIWIKRSASHATATLKSWTTVSPLYRTRFANYGSLRRKTWS